MDTPEGNSRRSWSGPQRGSGPRGTAGGTRATVLGSLTIPGRPEQVATARAFVARTLSSHQVGADNDAERTALLAACRNHVADDGCVIIQQRRPAGSASATDAEYVRDGIIFRVRNVSRPAPDLVSAVMEYADGDQVWTHAFTARRLDDAGLTAVLAGAGLRLDRYLTDDQAWLRAVPA